MAKALAQRAVTRSEMADDYAVQGQPNVACKIHRPQGATRIDDGPEGGRLTAECAESLDPRAECDFPQILVLACHLQPDALDGNC